MVVFIFSEAGKYISGMVFIVDGGAWHQYLPLSHFPFPALSIPWMESNVRSNITSSFKYPEMFLEGTNDLNVTGKKKSKL